MMTFSSVQSVRQIPLLIGITTLLLSFTSLANEIPATDNDFARPVKVVQLDIGKGNRERILPGDVRASVRASLSFRVAGQIAEIYVRPGQHVKEGEVLARLDSDLYDQQLEVVKAQFELAKVIFERNSALVEQGVVSRNEYDQSRSDFIVATAALEKAEADVNYTSLLAPYDGIISKARPS